MTGHASHHPTAVPRRLVAWLFLCGSVGPLLFDAVYTIDGGTRPGYNPWQQAISSLTEGPTGWVQQANFIYLGVITLAAAYIWRQLLAGAICATAYPIARGIEGMALIAIGFTLSDPLHTIWLFVIVGSMMAGLLIMARRFRGDPNWRGWVTYSVVTAVLINVFIALFGISQHGGPLHPFAGALERFATNAEALWGLALVYRLWVRTPFHSSRPTG